VLKRIGFQKHKIMAGMVLIQLWEEKENRVLEKPEIFTELRNLLQEEFVLDA